MSGDVRFCRFHAEYDHCTYVIDAVRRVLGLYLQQLASMECASHRSLTAEDYAKYPSRSATIGDIASDTSCRFHFHFVRGGPSIVILHPSRCEKRKMNRVFSLLLLLLIAVGAYGFAPRQSTRSSSTPCPAATNADADKTSIDPNEIVARRIVVKGDVQGGYYRSCVLNEAGRFRRLLGTMSPPDDTDRAEIYVEGKRKLVDGFVRWCKKGNVGLSQVVSVAEILEEEPTGLYDGFYVKTK